MEARRVRPRRATFIPRGSITDLLRAGLQVALEFASARRIPGLIAWARRTVGLGVLLTALVDTLFSGVPSPAARRNWRRFWALRRALSIALESLDAEFRSDVRTGHPRSLIDQF